MADWIGAGPWFNSPPGGEDEAGIFFCGSEHAGFFDHIFCLCLLELLKIRTTCLG